MLNWCCIKDKSHFYGQVYKFHALIVDYQLLKMSTHWKQSKLCSAQVRYPAKLQLPSPFGPLDEVSSNFQPSLQWNLCSVQVRIVLLSCILPYPYPVQVVQGFLRMVSNKSQPKNSVALNVLSNSFFPNQACVLLCQLFPLNCQLQLKLKNEEINV